MTKETEKEIIDAIRSGRIQKKDTGEHPPAHSIPYFYKDSGGFDWVLLKARKDSPFGATQEGIVQGYRRYKTLFPFLQKQNLGVNTPKDIEVIECDGEFYGVMERFFGHGHSPERFSKATKSQQDNFVKQVAEFFYKLHSISIGTLPKDRDYVPYFRYDKTKPYHQCGDVFLHADFNYSNFLVDDDYNLHAVFDWDPCCVGPRIAEFCTFIYCKDLSMLPLVLTEYNKIAGTSITTDQVIEHHKAREVSQ